MSAFISAGLFFVISSAKPLDRLSPQRPHPNIFCAYVFVSMLGQFALHTAFLIFVYNGAVAIMPKVGPWKRRPSEQEDRAVMVLAAVYSVAVALSPRQAYGSGLGVGGLSPGSSSHDGGQSVMLLPEPDADGMPQSCAAHP